MNKELQEIKDDFDKIVKGNYDKRKAIQEKADKLRKRVYDLRIKKDVALMKGDRESYSDVNFELEKAQKESGSIEPSLRSRVIGITENQFNEFKTRLTEYIKKIEKEKASKIYSLWTVISGVSDEYVSEYSAVNRLYSDISRAAGHELNVWDKIEESNTISKISARKELTPETIEGLKNI